MNWNICGYEIMPGEKKRIWIRPVGEDYEIPATAICGSAEIEDENASKKTLVITAAVHCDEYPGVAAVIRLAKAIDPARLKGRLLLVHTVNASGFQKGSIRFVPEDGGNLNGIYPGRPDGSLSERIADYFVKEILSQADFVADLHSGSVREPLSPCIFFPRAQKVRQASLEAAMALTIPCLIESKATTGEYSYAASVMNIPAILLERGHSGLCKKEWVEGYERDLRLLLNHLNLYDGGLWTELGYPDLKEREESACEKTVFTKNVYLEAEDDGLWYPAVTQGQKIKEGQLLGRQETVFGDLLLEYRAQQDGQVFYYSAGLSVRKGDALVAYGAGER